MGGRLRILRALLAGATIIPIGALAWLGVRVIHQDRALERQRNRERLEVVAGRIANAFARRLADIGEQLRLGNGMRFSAAGIDGPTLYQPVAPAWQEPSFYDAEQAEFRRNDLAGAAAAYRAMAQSADPAIRAGALVRLGRVLRKRGDARTALAVYDSLAQLGAAPAGGQPSELVAGQARCRMAEETGDSAGLRHSANGLAAALFRGSWRIDRETFELYRDMVASWGGPAPPDPAIARTEAALELWRAWRSAALPDRGQRVVRTGAAAALALWSGATVWIGAPKDVEEMAPVEQGYTMWLQDGSGLAFAGVPVAGGVSLYPAETTLPLVLGVAATGAETRINPGTSILIAGLALTLAFTTAAAYGLYRLTAREMALARQQADFVSAVSHEFRTPLTSMRHLTELLVAGDVPNEQRKAYYYELLANETERLHRMVETLLSFARIEAGAYAWHLETADARDLILGMVAEFRHDPPLRDHEVICDGERDLPPIRADREALSRAVWNLLENAAKYSAPGAPIHVFARAAGDSVEVAVEDRGTGIPKAEQPRIFQKFVRGEAARQGGVRGVGIGLALVQRIMEAHGGSVQVTSEPGRGSTFTLVFPCHAS